MSRTRDKEMDVNDRCETFTVASWEEPEPEWPNWGQAVSVMHRRPRTPSRSPKADAERGLQLGDGTFKESVEVFDLAPAAGLDVQLVSGAHTWTEAVVGVSSPMGIRLDVQSFKDSKGEFADNLGIGQPVKPGGYEHGTSLAMQVGHDRHVVEEPKEDLTSSALVGLVAEEVKEEGGCKSRVLRVNVSDASTVDPGVFDAEEGGQKSRLL